MNIVSICNKFSLIVFYFCVLMKVGFLILRQNNDPTNRNSTSSRVPVKKVPQIEPHLSSANIIVCVTAGIKANQFKALVKIEADSVCIAGLRFQNDGTPILAYSNLLCLIHQSFPDSLMAKFVGHP